MPGRKKLLCMVHGLPRLAATEPQPLWIIMIAEEPMPDANTMADMLSDLDEEHNANGTSLEFCELIGPPNRDHCFLAIDATSTPSVKRQYSLDFT
jgi:hypothetical protein